MSRLAVVPFDLAEARVHARIWADLATKGITVGPHDLLIAATGISNGDSVATLNFDEFARIPELTIIDARPFLRS